MKRVTFYTSIGFPSAERVEVERYTDEEFEDLTEADLYEMADEYAQQWLEAWFEVEDV
jgi:hypothetical protein